MIVAINPKNKHLSKHTITATNQGQLLAKLRESPEEQVLIDVELPGLLRIEDFLGILQERFPKAKFSTLGIKNNSENKRIIEAKIIISQLISLLIVAVFTIGMPQQLGIMIIVGCSLLLGIAFQLHEEIIDFFKRKLN